MQIENDAEFRALWSACLSVLRAHRFRIDRRDLFVGTITTVPETSQSFFEFWRHDVDSPRDLVESSLHTVRRWVEIDISSPAEGEEYTLALQVHIERLHAAERQVTNAAAAPRAFSTEMPTVEGRKFDPRRDTYWTPEGRDPYMEHRLLEAINKRVGS